MAVPLDENRILFLGGASLDDRTAEIYDTRSGVSRLVAATMRANHYGGAAARLADGRVLIAGGGHVTDHNDPDVTVEHYGFPACEIFDPANEQFVATGALHEPRMMHTATRLPDGRVLVSGGETQLAAPRHLDHDITATCELYDPAAGSWTTAAPLLTARSRHAAVLLPDGRVLFAGGFWGRPLGAAIYDPLGPTSMALSSAAGAGASAVLLRDGRVLIATGSSYELVDPATATVASVAGPAGVPEQTATLLPDSSVLFVGGNGPSARFDPVRGDVVVGPWPLTPRTGHTATLLPDGSVLIAGGSTAAGPVASVERFVVSPASSRGRAVRR